jgi:chromosome segregation ATPase
MQIRENLINKLKQENYILKDISNENYELKNKIKNLEKNLENQNKYTEEKEKEVQSLIIQISEIEMKLNNTIFSKEKIIEEKEDLINELKNKLKRQINENENLVEKTNKFNLLKEEMNSEIKNLYVKLNVVKEELHKEKILNEDFIKENNLMVEKYEEKIKEIVHLMQNQNIQLNEFSKIINDLENDNKKLNEEKLFNKKEIEILSNNLYEMNNNLNKQNMLIENYKITEKKLFDNEGLLIIEKNKNSRISEELNNIENLYTALKNEYSGENSLDNLYRIINDKENLIKDMEFRFEEINNYMDNKDKEMEQNETEILNFIKYIYQFLFTTTQWADTYMGVYTDDAISNIKIPELDYNNFNFELHHQKNSRYINDLTNSNLIKFCDVMNKIRKRLHEDLHYFNENLAKNSSENKNLKENISSLNQEIYKGKENLEKLNDQNNVDKNNLKNMRNDIKYFQNKLSSIEKLKEEEANINKKILIDIKNEYSVLYEIISSNPKFKSYSEFLNGIKINYVR